MAIDHDLRRRLLGTTGRSIAYLAAGVALFACVAASAWHGVTGRFVQEPPPRVAVAREPEAPPPPPPVERFVPPAEMRFPFY